MSGIYIKDMEMPTDHPLWIVVHPDGTVEANEVSASRPVGWQTLRNAAVPVPPHGALKDADALMCEWEVATNANGERFPAVSAEKIQAAPTIIPDHPGE